jgi:two-component system nitrate/nitrite response regulator NarL
MLCGNVLLVSKNHFMCCGLAQALGNDTLSVVGSEPSPEAALSLLQTEPQHVDLIVFDAESADSAASLRAIADQYPKIKIVILTTDANPFVHERVAESNVRALLPRSISIEALNLTLKLVLLGENLFLSTGQVPDGMRLAPLPQRAAAASILLSGRETEILRFIREGAPNKVIARELDVAEATVKVHVKSVLRKIEVSNRTQAAVWAMNHLDDSKFRGSSFRG